MKRHEYDWNAITHTLHFEVIFFNGKVLTLFQIRQLEIFMLTVLGNITRSIKCLTVSIMLTFNFNVNFNFLLRAFYHLYFRKSMKILHISKPEKILYLNGTVEDGMD